MNRVGCQLGSTKTMASTKETEISSNQIKSNWVQSTKCKQTQANKIKSAWLKSQNSYIVAQSLCRCLKDGETCRGICLLTHPGRLEPSSAVSELHAQRSICTHISTSIRFRATSYPDMSVEYVKKCRGTHTGTERLGLLLEHLQLMQLTCLSLGRFMFYK